MVRNGAWVVFALYWVQYVDGIVNMDEFRELVIEYGL